MYDTDFLITSNPTAGLTCYYSKGGKEFSSKNDYASHTPTSVGLANITTVDDNSWNDGCGVCYKAVVGYKSGGSSSEKYIVEYGCSKDEVWRPCYVAVVL